MRKIISSLPGLSLRPGAVVMAFICCGLLYAIVSGLNNGPETKQDEPLPTTPTAQALEPASSTPLEVQKLEETLEQEKKDLRATVKKCEEALNSYSWSDTPSTRVERIRWCSTQEFLEEVMPAFAFTDTEADRNFVEQRRRVEAFVDLDQIIGEFDEEGLEDGSNVTLTACQSVNISTRVIDFNATSTDPVPLLVQRNWVKTPEGWKIHSDIRYYESC